MDHQHAMVKWPCICLGGGCLHCEGDWVETGLEKLFLFHCVNIQDQNTTEQFWNLAMKILENLTHWFYVVMHSVLDSDVVRTNFTDVHLHEITISLVKVLFTMMTSHTLFQNKNKGIL